MEDSIKEQAPVETEQEMSVQPENQEQIIKIAEKKKYRKGFWAGFFTMFGMMMLLLVIVAVIVLNQLPQLVMYPNTNANSTSAELDLNSKRIMSKINAIQTYINNYYLFDKDQQKIEDGIYSGMVSALGDKYSEYYTEDAFSALFESMSGEYSGIGAYLQQHLEEDNRIEIYRFLDGSPAKEAGMTEGDIIIAADGVDLTKMSLDEAVNGHIKGPEGTKVVLTILRGDETLEFEVVRKKIEIPSVASEIKEGNIGYIEISSFEDVTDTQFIKEIDSVIEKGAESIIIDLRDNGGGVVDASVAMADYLLPDNLITYTADKNGVGNRFTGNDGHQVDLPIVILVNENTASASEIFTGALMDYDRATVVGTQTFGKGIIQNVYSLGDGSALKITTMHYYTPDGFDLHGEGLTPDVIIEPGEDFIYLTETDNQLNKALEILSE